MVDKKLIDETRAALKDSSEYSYTGWSPLTRALVTRLCAALEAREGWDWLKSAEPTVSKTGSDVVLSFASGTDAAQALGIICEAIASPVVPTRERMREQIAADPDLPCEAGADLPSARVLMKQVAALTATQTVRCYVCKSTEAVGETAYQCFYCREWLCGHHAAEHFAEHKDTPDAAPDAAPAQEGLPEIASAEMKIAGARSIANSMHYENHGARAEVCWRDMVANFRTGAMPPRPKADGARRASPAEGGGE